MVNQGQAPATQSRMEWSRDVLQLGKAKYRVRADVMQFLGRSRVRRGRFGGGAGAPSGSIESAERSPQRSQRVRNTFVREQSERVPRVVWSNQS